MFTGEQAIIALREVVAELGEDYVYPKDDCRYADGPDPSCIVGRVIFKLDPELFAKIAAFEDGRLSCGLVGLKQAEDEPEEAERIQDSAYPANDLVGWGKLGITKHFDDLAFRVLVAAQDDQDVLMDYGRALRSAERVYAEATA